MANATTGTLYSYPNNFRAQKALIAAEYSGAKVRLAPDFVFGETNRSDDFRRKFPSGKVPAFESADGKVLLTESNAIASYLGNDQLRGADSLASAQVLQWLSWADSELLPASCAWVFPSIGIMEANPKTTKQGQTDVLAALDQLESILAMKTYLVGERISLADIGVFCTLLPVYTNVFDPETRKPYNNVNRWFNTLLHQPQFVAAIGNIKLCDGKPAAVAAPKGEPKGKDKKKNENKQQKPQAEKPPKEAEPEDFDEPKEPPSKDPFDALPKGTFVMDSFKRVYSNESEEKSIPYFFENFDAQNYSIWFGEYKYNNELAKVFMSCNLITGMFQRLDKMRKQAFASCCLFGEDNNSSISGIWVWRGQDLAFTLSPDWQIDYESYSWTKLDAGTPETKALVQQYLSWTGKDKDGREFNQGKIFK